MDAHKSGGTCLKHPNSKPPGPCAFERAHFSAWFRHTAQDPRPPIGVSGVQFPAEAKIKPSRYRGGKQLLLVVDFQGNLSAKNFDLVKTSGKKILNKKKQVVIDSLQNQPGKIKSILKQMEENKRGKQKEEKTGRLGV